MLSRARIVLSWSFTLLALLGAFDLPVQGKSLIGLSLNLPEGAPESELYKIGCEERSDGLKLVYVNANWRVLPVSDLDADFALMIQTAGITRRSPAFPSPFFVEHIPYADSQTLFLPRMIFLMF